jgi:hypothetical protein
LTAIVTPNVTRARRARTRGTLPSPANPDAGRRHPPLDARLAFTDPADPCPDP